MGILDQSKIHLRAVFLHSVLVAIVATVSLTLATGFAKSPSRRSSADILVEVIATHTTPADKHRYLYLRVFSDGMAECQSSNSRGTENKERATEKALTKDEFMRFKSAIEDAKSANPGPKYETKYAIVDSWTAWKIEIPKPEEARIIWVLEFSPGLAKAMKHPYPDALVKLGCNIEKTRAVVLGESPSFDSECEKVLGAKTKSAP